jgi:hypothetical protein
MLQAGRCGERFERLPPEPVRRLRIAVAVWAVLLAVTVVMAVR